MALNIIWIEARAARPRQQTIYKQAWPSAWYGRSGKLAAEIQCDDGYSPAIASAGAHGPLTLQLLNHSRRPLELIGITPGYRTLPEAKLALSVALEKWEIFIPDEFKTRTPTFRSSGSIARMFG